MIPRALQCDDDRCDYDENGRWRHDFRCATQDPWAEDMAVTTAREDGYSFTPTPVLHLPAPHDRRWTA